MVQLIKDRDINLIAEEARHVGLTTVHQLATLADIYYANVDMPMPERARRGIPPNYNCIPNDDNDGPDVELVSKYNKKREAYMFERALEFMDVNTKAIVIVGQVHMNALKRSFERICDGVTERDVTTEGWFDSTLWPR